MFIRVLLRLIIISIMCVRRMFLLIILNIILIICLIIIP